MHFTSGTVEAEFDFPRLAIRVEKNLKPTCRDTVLYLIARPEPPDSVRGDHNDDSEVDGALISGPHWTQVRGLTVARGARQARAGPSKDL